MAGTNGWKLPLGKRP